MSTRIQHVAIRAARLTPAEAVLMIDVQVALLTPTTELRGRLIGPSSPYSTTIEVAYPVRTAERRPGHPPILRAKVVIPEPSWWDVDSPFLYHGPVELWEHEHKVDETRLRLGLRYAEWRDGSLVWNGRPLALRSQTLSEIDEPTLRSLRERGFNSVILPPGPARSVYPLADRIGMLVFSDADFDPIALLHPSAMALQPTTSATASAN